MTIQTRVLKRYQEYVVQWTDGEISWLDTHAFKFADGDSGAEAKQRAIDCAKDLRNSHTEAAVVWHSDLQG